MRRVIVLAILASLTLYAAQCWPLDAEKGAGSGGSVYEYDENDMPAAFFFPPEKARWDGTKVTIREWYMLTDYQKEKFITEYLDEMRKAYSSPIDVIGLDYVRALNMFSYFSNDKRSAEPTTKVIDTLLAGQGKVARAAPSVTPVRSADIDATVKIVAEIGDDITITLESNPTTGYSWQLKEPFRKDILELESANYDPDKTGLVGSGGRELWTFVAIGEGVTSVTLIYKRPWEKGVKPAKEARFLIAVLAPDARKAGEE